MLRSFAILVLAAASATAQFSAEAQHGTAPKPSAAGYPAHADLGKFAIGAEYNVRSVGGEKEMFVVPEYLVIEVAVYPAKGQRIEVTSAHFMLRINGKKKNTLFPQTPAMVAASLKYPDWEQRPSLVMSGGYGDGQIIVGRPRDVARFPGDRREDQRRAPRPQIGDPQQAKPGMTAEEVAVDRALPTGPTAGPISGYLYYFFKGKPKSIKSLELIYDPGEHPVTIRLF